MRIPTVGGSCTIALTGATSTKSNTEGAGGREENDTHSASAAAGAARGLALQGKNCHAYMWHILVDINPALSEGGCACCHGCAGGLFGEGVGCKAVTLASAQRRLEACAAPQPGAHVPMVVVVVVLVMLGPGPRQPT